MMAFDYNPLVLSLSKDTSGLEAWFDKLTTNGKFDKFATIGDRIGMFEL